MSKMSNLDLVLDEMITAGQKMIDAATALKEMFSEGTCDEDWHTAEELLEKVNGRLPVSKKLSKEGLGRFLSINLGVPVKRTVVGNHKVRKYFIYLC